MSKNILKLFTAVFVIVILTFTGCQSANNTATTAAAVTPEKTQTTTPTTAAATTATTSIAPATATTTTTPPEKTSETPEPATETPEEIPPTPTEFAPSFTITHMATDKERKYITSGEAVSCNILVDLAATAANEPGYYTIELVSRYTGFGAQELKYSRGDVISTLSWKVSGGDTWLALVKGESLETLFSFNFTYAAFSPKFPVVAGAPPSNIENAVFTIINDYRVRAGAGSLTWNQSIQDDARANALNMLVEGKAVNTSLESPYIGQLIYTAKTYSTESPEDIARKAYNYWMSTSPTKQILISEEFTTMAAGYVVESKESVYYIQLLFSAE